MTSPSMTSPPASGFIRADDVLQGRLSDAQTVFLEKQYGHGKLIRLLEVVGVGGPFKVMSPWELEDARGQQIINASGYAALPFGDNPPELNTFLREVLEKTDQVMFGQQSITTWRAALETNLVRLLARESHDHHDSRVFFSNSGTEAVEAAIKFAQAARPKAKYLINFTRAYHGKTLGSLAITPNPNLQGPFRNILNPAVITLPFGDTEAVERAIKRVGDQVIAVILEPILGEAGVRLPPPGFLKRVGEVCRAAGVLVIADEIQTGLGRTGHWFESVAQGLVPDILTLAKPLGGGMLPVGATIVRHEIYKPLLGSVETVKRHSNTFGGNSLAMAVGLKSLELLMDHDYPARSRAMGERGLKRLTALQRQHPGLLEDVRGAGMLFAMNFRPVAKLPFSAQGALISEVTGMLALVAFYRRGVLLNFSLNAARTMRLTPAMNMPDELFDRMFSQVEAAAAEYPSSFALAQKYGLPELLALGKAAFLEP
ncbi:class-III pyridoxal-phosphate-dependent aminotransferase [Deinococcus rubellus]|uniref:Aminotransferase class III-fold pyridoxal phosphate-dependent enzyme n=1 Tax=Deinococcus rubellus TaxID=1889240 RepID=A0ABY5YJP1_9DEIO|nr:aminotransferase class III-fold pyridoxal phosphate-dependent enzyme [Deinococcus rubellus]UWX64906.1 aminotransferase class III-fold pyridoxal phosphate-dependent enzyme [Deinococcus rubellus]